MTKIDSGLAAVRRIRERISHELGNDPARLVAHYIERQASYQGRILPGPEACAEKAPVEGADAADWHAVPPSDGG